MQYESSAEGVHASAQVQVHENLIGARIARSRFRRAEITSYKYWFVLPLCECMSKTREHQVLMCCDSVNKAMQAIKCSASSALMLLSHAVLQCEGLHRTPLQGHGAGHPIHASSTTSNVLLHKLKSHLQQHFPLSLGTVLPHLAGITAMRP